MSPGRYIQGRGILFDAAQYILPLGTKVLVIWDKVVSRLVGRQFIHLLNTHGLEAGEVTFAGEVTGKEIERLQQEARERDTQVVIGVGGGKTVDTAKAVGFPLNMGVVVIPTIASTDAPTSALAVVYSEEGKFAEYRTFPRNPDVVLVDTRLIVQAPTRYLIAGMGDALATWFEARAATRAYRRNMAGGLATSAALQLARLCYETLLEHGVAARLASQQRAITPSFERIVEANTLLSGLGFESCGLAAAHAIHNGLTAIPQIHQAYHGEKVAVGTVVQLLLEGQPMSEVDEVIDFCLAVGLPVGFHDLGNVHIGKDALRAAAEAAVRPEETIHNEPFPVTAEMVIDALLAADSLGRARRLALGMQEGYRRAA